MTQPYYFDDRSPDPRPQPQQRPAPSPALPKADAAPVFVRLVVLALVLVLGFLIFGPFVGIGGDAWEAYRDLQRDPFGNHTGVTPYGAPARSPYRVCRYDGARLTCEDRS